ncbi:hypothetical protein niasHT_010409 [Heterodera trifolii]|uniref:BTB domain-containing protein n=1 Tax=Heterodera trifolii TaxID=157864 RepID=A0ABD2MAK6_9BILA
MCASDVFESMFFPKAKTKSSADCPPVIEVTDVEAEAFKVMLSFIYAEDLSELNGQNAMAVLYAANKYNVSLLVKALLAFPINELPNVFLAFDEARLFNENDFSRRCLDYIDQNAQTLFESENFYNLTKICCAKFSNVTNLKSTTNSQFGMLQFVGLTKSAVKMPPNVLLRIVVLRLARHFSKFVSH